MVAGLVILVLAVLLFVYWYFYACTLALSAKKEPRDRSGCRGQRALLPGGPDEAKERRHHSRRFGRIARSRLPCVAVPAAIRSRAASALPGTADVVLGLPDTSGLVPVRAPFLDHARTQGAGGAFPHFEPPRPPHEPALRRPASCVIFRASRNPVQQLQ